jgi:hypothetical protein
LKKTKTIVIAVIAMLSLLICATTYVVMRPLRFLHGLRSYSTEREKHIIYDVNHEILALELRQFATEWRWRRVGQRAGPDIFWVNDDRIPPHLKLLKPTSIAIFDDRIIFESGGALLHFGIVVFRPGIEGSGTKRLGDGIWFFSEDGRIPSQ